MKKILVVVDMQNDFIDGALGTKEAQAIIDNAVKKIEEFDGAIYVTYDTHFEDYMETEEGKTAFSSMAASKVSRGTSTMPPPAPNSPFTAPAPNPARAIPMYLRKKTPPWERFSQGGNFYSDD